MKKALARVRLVFAFASFFIFVFFVLDLSLSYIPVYNTISGVYSTQPVISFLPILKPLV